MTRVTYSPKAEADLEDIWRYTYREWGADQADRYTGDIFEACLAIANGQRVARRAIGFDPYFKFTVSKHVVYFVQQGDGIFVMRVLHQSMDTQALL